jgi:tetratricopeptide (TPR) repeat protein
MGDVRLDEARRFAAAGRLQEAAATLKNLLAADPENREARSLLMEIQDRMLLELQVREKMKKVRALADGGQKEEAIRLAREILKISPENPEVHRFLKEAEGGAPPAAPSPFETVVADAADLLPDFAPPSPSSPAAAPPAPALEELPELRLDALDLGSPPPAVESTVLSGDAASRRLAPAEAQKVAQYLAEGKAHFEAGRYQDAIDAWTRIFIVDEENQEAQALIDQARERMGAHQEEIEHLLTEGIGAFNSGEYERARSLLERILAVFPSHREAQYYLDRLEEMKNAPPPAPPPAADTFELEDNLFTPTGPEMRTGAAVSPPPAPAGTPPAAPSPFGPAAEPSEFQLETGGAEDFPLPAAPAPPPAAAAPPPAPPAGPSGEPAPFAWDDALPASFKEAAAPAPPAPAPAERPAPERPAPAAERPAPAPARTAKAPSLRLVVGVFAALIVLGTGIFFGARWLMGGGEPEPAATRPLSKPPKPPKLPEPPPAAVQPAEPSPSTMALPDLLRKAREASAARDYAKAITFYQEALSRDAVNPDALQGLAEARQALARQQEENLRNEKFLKDYLYSVKSFKDQDYAEALRVAWRLIYPDDTLARQLGKREAVREIIRNGYYNWAVLDLRQENLLGADKNLQDLLDFDRSDAEAARLRQFVKKYSGRPLDENYHDAVRNLAYRTLTESP